MLNTTLLWVVTALYAGQVGVSLWYKQPAYASGYVVANLGLIWSMTKGAS